MGIKLFPNFSRNLKRASSTFSTMHIHSRLFVFEVFFCFYEQILSCITVEAFHWMQLYWSKVLACFTSLNFIVRNRNPMVKSKQRKGVISQNKRGNCNVSSILTLQCVLYLKGVAGVCLLQFCNLEG